MILMNFRIEMDDISDHDESFEEIKFDEEITDLELEVKIEKSDEKNNIKTEVFEENLFF
jgi:hypothetical protein